MSKDRANESLDWLTVVKREACAIPLPCDAALFHGSLGFRLRMLGWEVIDEFPMEYRARAGHLVDGRIDIVVLSPVRLAIELDRVRVRKKSWLKLAAFPGHRLAITRSPVIQFHLPEPEPRDHHPTDD